MIRSEKAYQRSEKKEVQRLYIPMVHSRRKELFAMPDLYVVVQSANNVGVQPNIQILATSDLSPLHRYPIAHDQGTYKIQTTWNPATGQAYRVFVNMENSDPDMKFWITKCTFDGAEAQAELQWGLTGNLLYPGRLLNDSTVQRWEEGVGFTWWQSAMFDMP